jgi:hypothetical protein
MTKFCPKCKESKSITEFYKSKATKDGLRCYCKLCGKQDYSPRNAKRRWEREKNIPEYRKKRREDYRKNKTQILKSNKIWRSTTFNGRLLSYKRSAIKRNLSWELTNEQFQSFWNQNCEYCGTLIKTVGIDRKDNLVGYKIDNCIPCCTICNKMKMNLTYDQFKTQIKLIYDKTYKR